MGQEKSQPGRDQKTSRGRRNPAEDMAKQWRLRIVKAKHAEHQTHAPGQHKKPRDRGESPGSATQFCTGADRDTDDIRPGQELAQVTISRNSVSLSQPRCSTAMRRAQTIPPPKPKTDTVKNALAMAPSGARVGCCSARST
jgi:hypothetical protein